MDFQKIISAVAAFLTGVWRAFGLFFGTFSTLELLFFENFRTLFRKFPAVKDSDDGGMRLVENFGVATLLLFFVSPRSAVTASTTTSRPFPATMVSSKIRVFSPKVIENPTDM